jgi:glycosyltransferase involved in cell wall biosynthesis
MDFKNNKFILFLSQRDITHPRAGGAEVYVHNALKKVAKEILIVHLSAFNDKQKTKYEIIDNIYYIRNGTNLFNLIIEGKKFYKKYKENVIAVIDHSNTHQFFTFFWARKKRIFFIHQLTLEIWSYFFGKPLGRVLEYFEELLLSFSKGPAITVSKSTEKDLRQRGFDNLHVCPEGNYIKNQVLPESNKGEYLIYVGRLVPYKRVEDAIYTAKTLNKKLYIIGNGPEKYKNKLKNIILETKSDTELLGFVDRKIKDELIKNAYLLLMPSIREGWGLVITESANLGTPSVVYPVNGTIEAVDYGNAGFVTKEPTVESLIDCINKIRDSDYENIRKKAFEYSLKFTWENTSLEFKKILKIIIEEMGVNYDEASNRYIADNL